MSAGIKVRDSTKDTTSDATLNTGSLDSEWELLAKDGWTGKYKRHNRRGRGAKYADADSEDDSGPTHGRDHGGKSGPQGPAGPQGPPGPVGPQGKSSKQQGRAWGVEG
jgi:hypothetical protein